MIAIACVAIVAAGQPSDDADVTPFVRAESGDPEYFRRSGFPWCTAAASQRPVVRANARRYFAVQAMMVGELGVMFVLIAIFPEGPARIAVSALGLLAVGSSAILAIKVARAEK